MKNMRIVTRIYGGFALVLMLLIVTTGFSFYSSSLNIRSFESLVTHEFGSQRQLSEAKIMFLLARKPEKALMYADDPILVKTTIDQTQQAINAVSEVRNLLGARAQPEFLDLLDQVQTGLGGYIENFQLMMDKAIGPQRIIQTVQVRKVAGQAEADLNAAIEQLDQAILNSKLATVQASQTQEWIMLGVSFSALVLGILAAWAIGRSVSSPVRRLQAIMQKIQQSSDLTLRLKSKEQHEIGLISQSFDSLMDRFSAALEKISQSSQTLGSAVNQVRTSGVRLQENSKQQTSIASSLNNMAEEASAQLQLSRESVHKAESLSALTRNQTSSAISSMRKTVESVKDVAQLVSRTGSTISDLNNSSAQIGGIIGTIKQIADQTNLLALNAAIEAARAGEQGRGFAVVADEVRKLAEDTAAATGQISGLIHDIQVQIEEAVSMTGQANTRTSSTLTLVGDSESGLEELSQESENLNEVFVTISEVLNRQDECMNRVLSGIQEITAASEVNSKSADGAADLADELESRAHELKGSVGQFKVSRRS